MRQDEGWPARDSGSRTVALGSAGCTQRARAVRTRHGSSLRWFESLSAVEKSKGHQQPKLSACTWEAQERSVSSEARLRAVTHGEHAATEDRAVLLRCRAARIRTLATTTEAVGKLSLGVPPHSTAQAAACRFVEESGAGVAGAGCDGAESAADARPRSSVGNACEVVGRGHGQRTREAMERVPSFLHGD